MDKRGFTLLEVIIYIALFGLIIGGAFTAAYNLLEGAQRHYDSVSVQQEGTFINRKLNWELTNAQSVSLSGAHGVHIEPGDVVFGYSGSALTLSRGDGAAVPITSAAHSIADVAFSITAKSGNKPASLRLTYTVDGTPFSFAKYLRQ
jgi:prepilin-type N-terminal cleavage/methylation domain-containing protein